MLLKFLIDQNIRGLGCTDTVVKSMKEETAKNQISTHALTTLEG
jgi:hypothetical protein